MHFDPGFLRPAQNISTHILRQNYTFIFAENQNMKKAATPANYLLRVGIQSLFTENGHPILKCLHLYFPWVLIVIKGLLFVAMLLIDSERMCIFDSELTELTAS